MRFPGTALSHASTRIICRRGNACISVRVRRAEAGEVLRRREREVHARLEDEPLLGRAVEEEALRVADVVRDRRARAPPTRMCAGWQVNPSPTRRGSAAQARTEEQGRRADRAAGEDDGPRADAVLARRPLRGQPFPAGIASPTPARTTARSSSRSASARVTTSTPARSALGELHAVGPLLRGVRAAEIAEARAPAPLDVDRELLGAVARVAAPFDEQPVVLVELLRRQEVDVVLRHVLSRARVEIGVVEAGHVPVADHPLGRAAATCRCRRRSSRRSARPNASVIVPSAVRKPPSSS